jgi:glycosyltransferase involved in cell wall biosynthesis
MSSDSITPLVSIITPSYNQVEFLENTIKSVLAQDYPLIEYLVVDGGSTDGSVETIQKYGSDLAWWVSEKDEGQASAINKGMARARGEIVAWLNSDDIYLPGAVEQAVEAFQANQDAGMVYGNALTIDSIGQPKKELIFPDWGLEDLIGFRIICQPAVFMERKLYEQVSGLDQNYHYMLDHHLWIRIAGRKPIKHIPNLWAAARHHESAKNVSQAADFGRETLELLHWMQSHPDLAPIVEQTKQPVLAGAYRLNARYLLDGGQYADSIKSYLTAFRYQPRYALGHWHRFLYAVTGFFGGSNLDRLYSRFQDSRRPNLADAGNLDNWPGLSFKQVD